MFRIKALESAVALIAFTACMAAAQASSTVTVTGRVTTSAGKPVPNARVYVPGSNMATETDAHGNYTLTGVPGGPQVVVVRQGGYVPVRTEAKFSTKPSDRERNHVNVRLLTPGEVATVEAQWARDSAGLARVGFFRRESTVRGAYFITPDKLASSKPVRVSDIFRGVPVVTEGVVRFGPAILGVQVFLLAYVDGLAWRRMNPRAMDTYVSTVEVVSAEAYGPGQLPQ